MPMGERAEDNSVEVSEEAETVREPDVVPLIAGSAVMREEASCGAVICERKKRAKGRGDAVRAGASACRANGFPSLYQDSIEPMPDCW